MLAQEKLQILKQVANTIRGLSIDQVEAAQSGHPGLPLGCAELGAYLFGHLLNYNPKDSKWPLRDRFILSAGHGSAFLYSCLHLAGFDLSIDELKRFRCFGSKTPGHPEYGVTDGVEATTGPLGQGVGHAVGQALSLKMAEAYFKTPISSKVYCLVGDGCMMEGISSEASSFAGHLKLNNLVLLYDANNICLDGPISDCFSDDVKLRYEAYGWEVKEIKEGNSLEAIDALFSGLKAQEKPLLVIVRTEIGKGSPNRAGSSKVHGSPLGTEEAQLTKKALGLPETPFYVPESVYTFFKEKAKNSVFEKSGLKKAERIAGIEEKLRDFVVKSPTAGRSASQEVVNFLSDFCPDLVGGSADLSCSDLTMLKGKGIVHAADFTGRNIKYGVREFAMGAVALGLAQAGLFTPYVGTFFTFSDYMKNAIRLAALSHSQVIYQFTHDSIFLGEDGPTHQPVEHLAALRSMPGVHVIRPADANEVKMAWLAALNYTKGPTALVLTRQPLPALEGSDLSYAEGVGRGAYVIKKESREKIDFTLFATGSEVSLAIDVAKELEAGGKSVRVVSMPCWALFEKQEESYKAKIIGGDLGVRASIESASSFGWHKWIGSDGIAIAIDRYGESAPIKELALHFGFTKEAIIKRLLSA